MVQTTLFLVGTALDLTGGYLVARGLLASISVLAIRTTSFWGGNPSVAVGAVEDRVDASFGLVTLASGFSLQAAGYFVTLSHGTNFHASITKAVVALGFAVVAMLATLGCWRAVRPRQVKRALVIVSSWDVTSSVDAPILRDRPYLARLAGFGVALESGRREGETDVDAVRRIFGITDTLPGFSSNG